jgi:hypothetical protein
VNCGWRGNEKGTCPTCSKEYDWRHILRFEGTGIWNDPILDKRFRNIDAEIGIRRAVGCKDTDKW